MLNIGMSITKYSHHHSGASMKLPGSQAFNCLTCTFRTLCFLLLIAPQFSWALGPPAGTTITNTATVSYDIAGAVQTPITSVPTSFNVDELVVPVLTWQDATPVSVNTPDSNNVLAFLLTNTGNGQETFSLTRINGPLPLPAGNYIPLNGSIGSIYLENGLQTGFQATGPNADPAYTPGANDPNLSANATQVIYVISDTPSVATNIKGEVQLNAISLTTGAAGATFGTALPGLGQGGGFAIVGTAGGQATATGSYLTSGLSLVVNKSVASVLDPNGTAVSMPGAVITYQLEVLLSGSGNTTNLAINDPLPANTTFVPNSIAVDGIAKTDVADADNAQFSTNTVSISLGSVAAPANIVITFRATIN